MKNQKLRKLYYHIRHRYLTMNNVVMAVALLVGLGWAWASVGAMQRNYDLQKEVDDKARQEKLLEIETLSFSYEQKYYKTTEYQELAVRDKLGLASPGEHVLLLPPNSDAAKDADAAMTSSSSAKTTTEPDSNFQQWMNFLFGGNYRSQK